MVLDVALELSYWANQPAHPYRGAIQGAMGIGGWERWAQLDFTLFCLQKYPEMNGKFILEDNVYADSEMRDDITITDESIIELKTRSRSGESFTDFRARVLADEEKLRSTDANKKLKPGYQASRRWAIGLVTYESIRFKEGPTATPWTNAQIQEYVTTKANEKNLQHASSGEFAIIWKTFLATD